jgi:signal transduction histidine kinase
MAQTDAGVIEAAVTARAAPGVRLRARTVRLGWAVFAVTSVAWAVAVVNDLHTRAYGSLAYVCIAEALAVMGVLLTTRMPQHRVSWVMAIAALWWGVSGLATAYAVEALVEDPGSLPGGLAAAWFSNWAWLPGLALFPCALLVLMPDGGLPSRRWWPAPVSVAIGTVLVSSFVSADSSFELAGTPVSNPLASSSVVLGAAGLTGTVLVIAGLVASLAAFVLRYRRSEGDRRQQLRWVVVSFGLAVSLAVAGALAWGVVPGAAALPALALLALPAGIAVAILKHRLYELDLVVNRAIVYVLLTIAVIGSYVVVVGLVGSYLSGRGDLLVSLVVTGVVAICFQPLRHRVQRVVNRLMYGERDDPYLAIAGLGRTLASSLQVDAVLPTAVETIGRTLALQYVGLNVAGHAELRAHEVAAYGTPTEDVLVFPLIHQGAPTGELLLAPRPGERLRERDHRLIADLAPQVAAAVHAVGLSQELQAARRRLVELREEERRRIRRDLHDGLGPALAGLTFTLDAVQNLADSDHMRANELLASATDQVQTLIADVRRLIYGLRPPALDELGLVAAMGALASREASLGMRVDVQAPDSMPPLAAAVEVAAYRIVQEALTNVARHAVARSCTVRVSVEPTTLWLEVADDGRGFSQRGIGVGLRAMRERAAELGGTCEITSAAGVGTSVSARLPLRTADEAIVHGVAQ